MWILGLKGLIGSFSIDEGESTVFFENTVESLLSAWFFKTPDFVAKSFHVEKRSLSPIILAEWRKKSFEVDGWVVKVRG